MQCNEQKGVGGGGAGGGDLLLMIREPSTAWVPCYTKPLSKADCGFGNPRLVTNRKNYVGLDNPIGPGGWSCKP